MTDVEEVFEAVYQIHDFWDGPLSGIADFHGKPHIFERVFDEALEEWTDFYLLAETDQCVADMAAEQDAIFQRWRSAFDRGDVASDTHPCLPEERHRYDELESQLTGKFSVRKQDAITQCAHFTQRGVAWRNPD